MANHLKMAEVQAILTLAQSGWSQRHIARQLGVDRETVARHLRLSIQDNSKPASAPPGSDPAPTGFEGTLADSPAAPPGSTLPAAGAPLGSVSTALPWRDLILEKLEAGLTARRIWQDLCSDHAYAGSYWSVRRLINKLTAVMPAPFRRMECEPGAEAQVDFGRGAPILASGGKRKATWVLRRVEGIGPHATQWARSMLQNRGVEGIRVLQGLLSLSGKHSRRDIERACEVAHGHGAYYLRSLRQLIDQQSPPVQQNFEFTQAHPIIRDLDDYGQFVRQAITQQTQESTP